MSDFDSAPAESVTEPREDSSPRTSRIKRISRLALNAVLVSISIFLTLVLVRAFDARRMAELQPWHTVRLQSEIRAREMTPDFSLDDYLRREETLFAELQSKVYASAEPGSEPPLNRYTRGSPCDPSSFTNNGNRTYELVPSDLRGGALLLHGLTDSPYSLRAVAEILHEQGFYVLGLRLPGHGTTPGELARMKWEDWMAAAELGARHVRERIGAGLPFLLVGYSNGGALCVKLTLDSLEIEERPIPDRLVLFSPAIGLTSLARLSKVHRLFSFIPYFEKSKWKEIEPEYDPFKYNSFPMNAADETFALTQQIRSQIEDLRRSGTLAQFPPTLTFQSLADSTVFTRALVEVLYDRLESPGHELVLFDVNRRAALGPFLRVGEADSLIDPSRSVTRPYTLTVITNRNDDSWEVVARSFAPLSDEPSTIDLSLSWPPMVYSLSHVAIPFSPSDPVYGDAQTENGKFGSMRLGSIEPRGERDLLRVSVKQLMRLRYNPFFPYIERRLRATVSDL